MYLGDYRRTDSVEFSFTTRASTGIPTVLAGTPVVTVWESGNTSDEVTSATGYVNLTIDFDGIVGLNRVGIDLNGNQPLFEGAKDFTVAITTGTVDGVSVVGEVIGTFSIEKRFENDLRPSGGFNAVAKDSPSGFTITSGENESGTEDNTHSPDANVHIIEAVLDATQKIEVYYEFGVGAYAQPTHYTAKHVLTTDTGLTRVNLVVSAYNWVDAAWEVIGQLDGWGRSTGHYDSYALYADHVEVGVGTVRIQYKTGSVALAADCQLKVNHAYISYHFNKVNVALVSDDATAADNLELMYDGTGYNADTAPASRAQVGALGLTGGGTLNFQSNADNSGGAIDPGSTAFVGNETNNYTDTALENGTYHIIADAATVIDVVYGFSVGGGRTATEMMFRGFANANNDDLAVSVWDHVNVGWDVLGTLEGKPSTTNVSLILQLLSRHTGTSLTEIGKVYIRFNGSGLTASADLNTDQILVEAVSIGQSVGYDGGAIWVDTNASNTNTEPFVDGVADNPVSTWAAALTLAAATNLTDFHILNGSTIPLSASSNNYSLFGDNWSLALNGKSVVGIHVEGANVSGVMAGTGDDQTFDHCHMGATSLIKGCHFIDCAIEGTQTLIEAGDIFYESCSSGVAGSDTWTFDFGAVGSSNLHMRNYSGGVQIENMGDSGTDTASIEGRGQIIEGTCTAGAIAVRGPFTTTGITNITLTDGAMINMTNINEECDAALVTYGLDHLLQTSVTGTDVADNSIFARLASKTSTADWDTFVNTTDSLQALRDFFTASVAPEIPAAPTSSLLSGTFIAGAVEDVRRYTDEPSVNAKWNDSDILAKLNEAWDEVYVDVTFNAKWPVLVRYNLSFSSGTDYVLLPPNVGRIVQVARISDADSRQIIWELDTRDIFDARGWGIRINGNTLELGSNWRGSTETLELLYIPSGRIDMFDGTWSGSEAFSGKSLTLPTTATNGQLPTLPNSLAGYMFRTIIAAATAPAADDPTTIAQEHLITAYNPVTRVVTLATDQNPAIDVNTYGTVTWEIVPILHGLMRGIVSVRAAQNILSAEGNKDRAGMLALEYRRKIRSLKLQLATMDARHATQFEGGTRDDPRSNRWRF